MTASTENKVLSQTDVLLDEYKSIHGDVGELGDEKKSEEEKLVALRKILLKRNQAALCLSGGGIRSATFCLGVLQGLARWGELKKFHYLSTVSGGGYIGSWLSRWVHEEGLPVVVAKLGQPTTATGGGPEPRQIRHLRSYSSYLAPQRGLSKDTLTLVAIYLRNLFLNWLVLIPLIIAVGLLPRLLVLLSVFAAKGESLPFVALLLVGFLAAIIASAFVSRNLPPLGPNPGPSRSVGLWFTLPLIVAATALSLSFATQNDQEFVWWSYPAFGAGGGRRSYTSSGSFWERFRPG